jgi:hypothetical protein
MVMIIKFTVFRGVTSCSPVYHCQHFRGSHCLHIPDYIASFSLGRLWGDATCWALVPLTAAPTRSSHGERKLCNFLCEASPSLCWPVAAAEASPTMHFLWKRPLSGPRNIHVVVSPCIGIDTHTVFVFVWIFSLVLFQVGETISISSSSHHLQDPLKRFNHF